jgi:predicted RND superfamily exporter protein
VSEIISTLATLISIASSAAGLGYWLARQFEKIEMQFEKIDMKFKEVYLRFDKIDIQFKEMERRMERLERGIFSFNELLLKVLEEKDVISRTEAISLMAALQSMIPSSRTKYYTKEVENRLRELLGKDPEKYTLEDIKELERIADIMEDEYMVSGRKELIDYAAKLRVAALVLKVVFVEPKMRKLKEWPLGY